MKLRSFQTLVLVICLSVTGIAADSESPLADAIQRHDRHSASELLRQAVDVDATQPDGMTALHWAVYHDDLQTTKRIIAAGANVEAENRYGVTPLSLACQNGNGAIVHLLLKSGADANAALRGGESALMTAARTGRLGAVKTLMDRGADLNATERKGQTALMWAAAEGHTPVVDALIDRGADFRTPLQSGFTPLFFAVREGHTEVVFRLLDAGIDVNEVLQTRRASNKGPKDGTSPLILAIENGHFELAVALLEAGADPNDDRCGFTALHAITWVRKPIRGDGDPPPIGSGTLNSLDLVRELVAKGAGVNARHRKHKTGKSRLNRTGATPLLLAAETGDVALLQLLVELGADPLLANEDHCTPLLAASGVGVLSDGDESAGTENDAIEAIRFLLKQGADINSVDDQGKTCMHGAAFKSWSKLVAFLAVQGADIDVWNRKNQLGWTPLMIAQGHRPGNFRPSQKTIVAIQLVMSPSGNIDRPWHRHVIDDSSRGADGTRLADVNSDGLMDVVTGWEQGGVTRVYVNPGLLKSKQRWPAVTVGKAVDVEDAVLVDLDGDGSLDVVSSCEGKGKVMLVHWAPNRRDYLDPNQWKTVEIPDSKNHSRWMFAAPMDVDSDGQVDLLAGGKSNRAELGWWKLPSNARDVDAWKWNRLRSLGWLMSLDPVDMDGDGDQDVLFTDRKGKQTGCFWLENPSDGSTQWKQHTVGVVGREAMFLHRTDLDGDTLEDILVAVRPDTIVLCRRLNAAGTEWKEYEISVPPTFGGAKAVAAADLDGDGRKEIVFTTEGAKNGKMGVGRFVCTGEPFSTDWKLTSISGVDGIKHDLVELIDLDGDGDLDLLTCEESKNLGVIWYENPR